jgi:lipoate-protein ligase B
MSDKSQNQSFCIDLPITAYSEAWTLQRNLVNARRSGILDRDLLVLLEHFPVFTLGRRGENGHLTVSEAFLQEAGIAVIQVERGGHITFHGPGQLVLYPIFDLRAARLGVNDYVARLEQIMLQVARDWGIKAERHIKNRGVWVGERKLGSVGIALRRGICFHGLALNISLSLEPFQWIHPCGLPDVEMTSMAMELGRSPSMAQVRQSMKRHIETVFHIRLVTTDLPAVARLLGKEGSDRQRATL